MTSWTKAQYKRGKSGLKTRLPSVEKESILLEQEIKEFKEEVREVLHEVDSGGTKRKDRR